MWTFDIEKQTWMSLKLNGDVPSPRSGYSSCAVGDRIYLFGGVGDTVMYRDFFIFNVLTNYWTQITDLELPTARQGACMASSFPYFFIYGGVTANSYDGSFYVINLKDRTVTQLSGVETLPELNNRAYSQCWAYETQYGDIEYLLAVGETDGFYPIDSVYIYSLNKSIWTLLGTTNSGAKSVAAYAGDKLFFASGEAWGARAVTEVVEYDILKQNTTYVGFLDKFVLDAAGAYVKTALYIHNGVSSIEKKIFYGQTASLFQVLELNKNCEEFGCSWPCSIGTYQDGEGCTFCPKGTYNDEAGATSCKKCPAGTFSNRLGNTLLSQCYHCQEGQFNSKEGAKLCLDCPNGTLCSIGSVKPDARVTKAEGVKSNQPASYLGKDFNFSYFIIVFQYSMIALVAPVLVVFLFLNKEKRLGFKKLDIYHDFHNYFVGEVMILKVTVIGGLASVLFALFALLFLITALIVFIFNNVTETKALVPLVTLEDDFDSVKSR